MMNFFPDLAKEFHDEGSMKAGEKGHPTKGRIEFREKSTIRLAKTRHVISLHVSTRSSVIDRFESPSKVAPLFRGMYLLVLVASHPLYATVLLLSQHICTLHEYIRRKMLYSLSFELSRYRLTRQ